MRQFRLFLALLCLLPSLVQGQAVFVPTSAAKIQAVSSNTTLDATYATILVSGNTTITLPDATACAGRIYVIIKTDTGTTLTLNTTSSQTIDGQASGAITTGVQYKGFTLQSNGANWILLGAKPPSALSTPSATAQDNLAYVGSDWKATPVYDANNATIFSGLARLVGDGSTDNAAALQARFDAIGTAGGKCTLQLPPGNFYIGSQVNWPVADNITLAGTSRETTKITCNFGGYPATSVGIRVSAGAGTITGVTVRDLTLQGLAKDDTGCYEGLTFNNTINRVTISNCNFLNFRHSGLRVTASVYGSYYRISHCNFIDCLSPSLTNSINGGAILGVMVDTMISDCLFVNCGNNNTSHAVYANGDVDTLTVAHCIFDARSGTSNAFCKLHFPDSGNLRCLVVGNQFLGDSTAYVTEYMSGTDLVVVGNMFQYAKLQIYSGTNQIVSGNTFHMGSAQGQAITQGAAATSTNLLITANNFYQDSGATNADAAIYANSGWLIGGNNFYGCRGVYIGGAGATISGVEIYNNRFDYATYNQSSGAIVRIDATTGGNHKVWGNRIVANAGGVYYDDRSGLSTNFARDNTLTSGAKITDTGNQMYPFSVGQQFKMLYGSATYDPPSLSDGATAQTTITVTGATTSAGNFVQASFTTTLTAGFIMVAQVTAADTVTVTFINRSGGTVDLASGTLSALVTQRQ